MSQNPDSPLDKVFKAIDKGLDAVDDAMRQARGGAKVNAHGDDFHTVNTKTQSGENLRVALIEKNVTTDKKDPYLSIDIIGKGGETEVIVGSKFEHHITPDKQRFIDSKTPEGQALLKMARAAMSDNFVSNTEIDQLTDATHTAVAKSSSTNKGQGR